MQALVVVIFAFLLAVTEFSHAAARTITSLGRIEPAGGVVRLAGPSGLGSVIMDPVSYTHLTLPTSDLV